MFQERQQLPPGFDVYDENPQGQVMSKVVRFPSRVSRQRDRLRVTRLWCVRVARQPADTERPVVQDNLGWFFTVEGDHCTQDLVPPDTVADGFLQQLLVQLPGDPHGDDRVVRRRTGRELVEEPQPLLARRQWTRERSVPWDDRPALRPSAREQGLLELVPLLSRETGQPGNSGRSQPLHFSQHVGIATEQLL